MAAALFAQTMAQMGQRVLLVDANMRRPMLHRYLGADNIEGLSSLLTDLQLVLENLVQNIQEGWICSPPDSCRRIPPSC